MDELKDITFKQFVENCEALVDQYEGLLSPFFNAKMVRCWKKMIYGLNIEEWRRDRIWETLNGDFDIDELKRLV